MANVFQFPLKCKRIAVLLCITSVAVLAQGPSRQTESDFSGVWRLDVKASQQNGIRGSEVMEIKQTGSNLKIRYQSTSRTLSYVIDGKETLANFAADGVTTAKTRWDGAALVIESHHHDNNHSFVADTFFNYRYSLSSDQKTLIVVVQGMRPPVSGIRAELVYQRR